MLKKVPFFLLFILLMSSCQTDSNNSKAQYLLVILSNYGKITKAPSGQYQLILDHGAIENVVAFTNRPERQVKQMTAQELAASWNQGPNSFQKDPPNATVVINQHLQTVILTSVEVIGDQTVFTIKPDGGQPLTLDSGVTQLFIDTWIGFGHIWGAGPRIEP